MPDSHRLVTANGVSLILVFLFAITFVAGPEAATLWWDLGLPYATVGWVFFRMTKRIMVRIHL
jgi:hypothetical protein